jgi:hypothetical protein
MKKIFLFACAVLTALASPASAAPVTETSVPIESDAQYEAQISFFKSALDEFGPADPDEAVRLWVKGDETRNGVFKYAAASPPLKLRLAGRWGAPEKNFWIIGTSSPWLSGCDIESRVVKSPTVIRFSVRYYWQTSAGPSSPTAELLYVIKYREKWLVDKVVPLN